MGKPAEVTYIPGHTPPRSWKRLNIGDILTGLGCIIFLAWFFWRAMDITPHAWDWASVRPYLFYRDLTGNWQSGILLRGLYATIRLGMWSMLLALVSGSLIGVLSAHQRGLAALPANIYINILRNTPPLVLLFLVFFFSGSFFTEPLLNVQTWVQKTGPVCQATLGWLFGPPGQWDRMAGAILTLGLYEGAYVAEIVRAGIESVPKNQWEASTAQGFTRWQQQRHIIAPQAIRLMLPPMINQTISAFKDTTLASIISLPELTFQSLEVMAVTRMTFELWLTTSVMYLLLSYIWALGGRWLEERQRWRPLE